MLSVAAMLLAVTPASALDKPATCATLQTVLNGAAQGDVITLNSSDGLGGLCHGHYDLKSFPSPIAFPNNYTTWQFQGDPSNGIDGFDGSDLNGTTERMLTGVNVHRLELQNLVFRDGTVTGNGGALDITGLSTLGLRNSLFFKNHATGKGGAVHFAPDSGTDNPAIGAIGVSGSVFGSETNAAEGNTATTGGGLSIESPGTGNNNSGINGSTFANNTATGNGGGFAYAIPPATAENLSLNGNVVVKNKAGGSGGGAHVLVANTFLGVDNELYEGNSVEPVTGYPPGDHFGGGLFVRGGLPNLRHNVFRGNAVKAFPVDGGNLGGGGLAVMGPGINAQSEYSRIEDNTVAAPKAATQFEAEGGGLFFNSDGRWQGFLDAISGNAVGDRGEGGGIYTGAAAGATSLELAETTVAGNTVGVGGQFAGIAGDPQDDLLLWNSIVYTGGAGDIGGFDSFDIRFSDACTSAGQPFTGGTSVGNICSDPKLVGGADVHQTAQSPTIDKGDDALLNLVGGERAFADYEGDPRPTDGDGDGHTTDMGADESPAFVAPPPPPPPTPQCSDQVDNDSDGAIDAADPGCLAGPTDNNEGDETPGDLVLCGQRTISLVRADVAGKRVVLSGFVATSAAGQKVQLTVRYLGQTGTPQKLGSVTPGADGQFQARVKKPPKRLFNDARYQAKVGSAKSVELKLPQSLASSSLKQAAGGTLELRGRVDRALLGKRNPVVIKRILCGKYTTVGQARPNKKGAYIVRFPSPPSQGSALYRAETKVLARPGSKRYVKQFARAIGITF